MKALRVVAPGRRIELHDVERPTAGPNDVLVRVRAAGICHTDAHYRAGRPAPAKLPITPGHEVAGSIEAVGSSVPDSRIGERVCLHYLVTCGDCRRCALGQEQFCETASMLGSRRDGGWGEYIAVPARNAITLPDDISFVHGAVLMCSAATSLHALNRASLVPGESIAIFGLGGLGMSAIQLAMARGMSLVIGVDIDEAKLDAARAMGVLPVNARVTNPVAEIRRLTGGRGVDVTLEVIGLPETIRDAMGALDVHGRSVVAGLTSKPVEIDVYRDLLGRETSLIGANDHLLEEIPTLLDLAAKGYLDMGRVATNIVPLDADAVNGVLDDLDHFRAPPRSVIQIS